MSSSGGHCEHSAIPPKLFTAKTPLGTYQGMTDQIEFSSLPQGFTTTVLHPMGADQPEGCREQQIRPDSQRVIEASSWQRIRPSVGHGLGESSRQRHQYARGVHEHRRARGH
jgi:hypothetical protein